MRQADRKGRDVEIGRDGGIGNKRRMREGEGEREWKSERKKGRRWRDGDGQKQVYKI